MKRRAFLRNGLWILASPAIVRAQVRLGPSRVGPATGAISSGGAAPCTVLDDNVGAGTTDNVPSYLGGTSYSWIAARWFPTDSITRCKFSPRLFLTGSLSGTLAVSIFADSGGSPPLPTGSSLAGPSSTVNISTLSTSSPGTYIDFTGISFTPTANTNYFVGVNISVTSDASDFITWTGAFGSAGNGVEIALSTNGSSWVSGDSTGIGTLKTWHS